MKFQITIILVAAVFGLAFCQDYPEYGDKPIKSRQGRGPLVGRPNPKQQLLKTTSTTEAPAEEGEYDDLPIEEEPQETPTTTTEAPKKTGKGLLGTRPFRSNTDLIEALKRRRQNAGRGAVLPAPQKEAAASASTSAEQASNGGGQPQRRNPSKSGTASNETGRKFSTRGSQSRGAQQESSSTEAPSETTKSSRHFARGRRF